VVALTKGETSGSETLPSGVRVLYENVEDAPEFEYLAHQEGQNDSKGDGKDDGEGKKAGKF
jgi:hypothetical protein